MDMLAVGVSGFQEVRVGRQGYQKTGPER